MDKNKFVLVVDDFSTMRRIVKTMLKENGFLSHLEAEDGAKAFEILKRSYENISMVISDWNMPNMDGFELLKAIKACPSMNHIPVIMVTAEAKKENIIAAAQAGAAQYIVKPFTADVFRAKLEKVLSKYQ